jgi:exosortase/archaeosortase
MAGADITQGAVELDDIIKEFNFVITQLQQAGALGHGAYYAAGGKVSKVVVACVVIKNTGLFAVLVEAG